MSLSGVVAAAVDGGVVGADGGFPVGSALKEGQGLRHHALIKKITKFSSYVGKFRWNRL
jgi:hypothetical protein